MRVLRFIAATPIAVIGLALACMLAGSLVPARAEKRIALVIGNGTYQHADKLANPVNDDRGMRDVQGIRRGREV